MTFFLLVTLPFSTVSCIGKPEGGGGKGDSSLPPLAQGSLASLPSSTQPPAWAPGSGTLPSFLLAGHRFTAAQRVLSHARTGTSGVVQLSIIGRKLTVTASPFQSLPLPVLLLCLFSSFMRG